MKKMKKIIFTIFGVLIFCGLFAQEIPQKISYQGKLLESGVPVTGTKSIVFTIDTWTETHPGVQVTDGLYSVTLGETTPIPTSIFDNTSSVNLQISVAGTSLTPQTEILSVPYAYKAETAASLSLPYSGTYSGSSDAFKITNTGTGRIGFFEINNSANTANVQYLRSNGTGPILRIVNDGTGDLINITNDGSAGRGIRILQHANKEAISISSDGNDRALYIESNGNGGEAARLRITNSSNVDDVVYAYHAGSGNAGYFIGNVEVTGNFSSGNKYFKIDHPLDPENKYLYHSCVESSEMMNVYNGNIILDNNGKATIELPEWFDALNKEFRYQLTCIGGYSPVYIAEEISNNSFKISGGTSGMKISWQITGIRQDPYANENRIQVEVEKSAKEKGHYLHYKAYNQPIEKSIEVVKDPEILEELKKNNKK